MEIEKKPSVSDESGGLMYQQLRKFINVIVSKLFRFKIACRMNYVMLVYNNTSSCQELQCWEGSPQVNHLYSNLSLDLIFCQEVMVW